MAEVGGPPGARRPLEPFVHDQLLSEAALDGLRVKHGKASYENAAKRDLNSGMDRETLTALAKNSRPQDMPPPLCLEIEGRQTADKGCWRAAIECLVIKKIRVTQTSR